MLAGEFTAAGARGATYGAVAGTVALLAVLVGGLADPVVSNATDWNRFYFGYAVAFLLGGPAFALALYVATGDWRIVVGPLVVSVVFFLAGLFLWYPLVDVLTIPPLLLVALLAFVAPAPGGVRGKTIVAGATLLAWPATLLLGAMLVWVVRGAARVLPPGAGGYLVAWLDFVHAGGGAVLLSKYVALLAPPLLPALGALYGAAWELAKVGGG